VDDMVEKVEAESKSMWLLMHPRHTVLVTCVDEEGHPNIITLAWSMITSFNPTMVAISVAPARYSHDLIKGAREFVVNVPNMDIVKETLFCGRNSGRNVDKFAKTGLTPLIAKNVKPPLIKECVAHLECKVVNEVPTGDHTIFVGEVVAASVNEGVFDKNFNPENIRPVLHNGYDDFVTINPEVTTPPRN
jgi:flavin reductase (DIM6/NTAB) family NADH-FMN oxidoreductase RutF